MGGYSIIVSKTPSNFSCFMLLLIAKHCKKKALNRKKMKKSNFHKYKKNILVHIVVVTKKPPMYQIIHFSLYCINGSIEGKHITLENSNNTLLAMKSELHTEEFL